MVVPFLIPMETSSTLRAEEINERHGSGSLWKRFIRVLLRLPRPFCMMHTRKVNNLSHSCYKVRNNRSILCAHNKRLEINDTHLLF